MFAEENPEGTENLGTTLESNEVRAANLVQLANGGYVVKNATFRIFEKVSKNLLVKSYKQRNKLKGDLWIDSGTNISTMGRSF